MAGPAPKTRMWSARENVHKPKGMHLIVTGMVEVSDADKEPVLTEGTGGGPKVLALDLAIKKCGDPAIKAAVWKHDTFHKEVSRGEFDRVSIRWGGKEIATVPVIDDSEHSDLLDKLSDVQDAKYGKKGKPKKAAKKAAKKVAKKASKKAKSRKSAKKAAKKPAQRSALKKLVRRIVKKLTPTKKKKGRR